MTLSDADRQRIAERYPRRSRPWLIPVIGVPLLALVVYWLWLSAFHSNPPLAATVASFEVLSADRIHVTVLVDRSDPDISGRCLVFAQAPDYERVGETMLEVPPSQRRVENLEITLRTFRESTSASVGTCTAD